MQEKNTKRKGLVLFEKIKEQIISFPFVLSFGFGIVGGSIASLLVLLGGSGSSIEFGVSFGVNFLWTFIVIQSRTRIFHWRHGYPIDYDEGDAQGNYLINSIIIAYLSIPLIAIAIVLLL